MPKSSLSLGPGENLAFDLDVAHFHHDDRHLRLVLPLESLERVVAGRFGLNNWMEITLKANSSIQVFEPGVRPVTPIVRALRNVRQMGQHL